MCNASTIGVTILNVAMCDNFTVWIVDLLLLSDPDPEQRRFCWEVQGKVSASGKCKCARKNVGFDGWFGM